MRAKVDHEPWVVLIGDDSDAETTSDFLRDLWPEVECNPAFTRRRQRRTLCRRSAKIDPVAPRDAVEGDR